MDSPIDRILDHLDGVSETSSGWMARCPAHDDNTPSLSISEGDNGRVLLHCHAGCDTTAVVEAIGLSLSDLYPDDVDTDWSPFGNEAEEIERYRYQAASGEVVFDVVRFELVDPTHPAYPDKVFLQRVPGEGWGRQKYGVEPVLYRLPNVLDAAENGRVVFVVEGEKDVKTLAKHGLVATSNPQGAGEWKSRYSEALEDAHVVILPDNDEEGRRHAEDVGRSVYEAAASVRIVELPGLPPKGDVTDWLDGDHTADELQEIVRDTDPLEERPGAPEDDAGDALVEDDSSDKDPPQAELLVRLASDDLFHTPDGTAYITYKRGDATRTAAIGSSAVTDYLRAIFYDVKRRPPHAQALQDARNMLRARAQFEGYERDIHLRVAEADGRIYVDLCDEKWRVVEITPDGWSVIDAEECPVRFRRTSGMEALPVPERGGSLELLREHVPVQDDDGFALLLGYLIQALRPTGPYPALELTGEQGSGKTTAARMIRALADPSRVPVRTRPREERDLAIAAENGWILAFDNLSGISTWLSDAFCRLATGGGFGTRTLYANREEELFYSLRPLILNGIDDLTTRGDLADRAITLRLEAIPPANRRTESEVWNAFERDRPRILGALFDALSTALGRISDVQLDRLPRMADFAEWVVAAEPALPIEEGTFLQAYTQNRAAAREDAVASDTVASAIVEMLEDEGPWTGKTSTLVEDLREYLPDPDRPPRDYPQTYQAMAAHLRRIMPALRAVGIKRIESQGPKRRQFTLEKTKDTGPLDSRRKPAEAAEAAEKRASAAAKDSAASVGAAEGSGKRRNENRPSAVADGDHSADSAASADIRHQSKEEDEDSDEWIHPLRRPPDGTDTKNS